jgi:hypothetical protein
MTGADNAKVIFRSMKQTGRANARLSFLFRFRSISAVLATCISVAACSTPSKPSGGAVQLGQQVPVTQAVTSVVISVPVAVPAKEDPFLVSDSSDSGDSAGVDVDVVGFDDGEVVPQDDSAPVTVQAQPSTSFDRNRWTLPTRVPVRYQGAEPTQLALEGIANVAGVSIGVPTGWVAFQDKAEVLAAQTLNQELRGEWFYELQSNPSQRYLVPADQMTNRHPTAVVLTVAPKTTMSAADALLRTIDFAESKQFRLESTGYQKWLGRDAQGAVMSGPGGALRFLVATRMSDNRLIILQTSGSQSDVANIHAQILQTATVGPIPPVAKKSAT